MGSCREGCVSATGAGGIEGAGGLDSIAPKLRAKVKLLGSRDRFTPFGNNGIAFVHGHAGVFREHSRTTTPSPRDEIDEMLFAEGCGPAWRVRRHGAAFD